MKAFSLTEDRYDQGNFMGRLSRIKSIFNPFLLTKSSADIQVRDPLFSLLLFFFFRFAGSGAAKDDERR